MFGLTKEEIKTKVKELGLPAYIGDQITNWLYKTRIASFDEMTNISKANRDILSKSFIFGIYEPVQFQVAVDGTRKYLYPAAGNRFIETAYMPELKRNTLCVSTQVGCKMGCLFCMTAKQGFQANLCSGEILNQLRSLPERELVTNIVFMGMGEPFDNTLELMKSLEILTSEYGFGMSSKKITVSTIGLIPGLEIFLEQSKCNLAISMHSPFDDERSRLMPVGRVYPIHDIVETLIRHDINRYRKLSFEYILFKGINDTPRHIKELARLLNKLRCRINLMRWHPVPGSSLQGSDEETIRAFQEGLNRKGITTTIRHSRGLDIDAACGLLSTKKLLDKS